MTAKESLKQLIENLPEIRLRQLLEYGQFLNWQEERIAWKQFGQQQFARAFGTSEPDYST